jgi:hypothetical protein
VEAFGKEVVFSACGLKFGCGEGVLKMDVPVKVSATSWCAA